MDEIKIKKWGGAQKNAGRPKGKKNKENIEKDKVKKAVEKKIMRIAGNLIESQANVALGCQFLYVVKKDDKGKNLKPELVKNSQKIEAYLAGELDGLKDEYYYITTEKPDSNAVDSLLDRGLGKVPNTVQGKGENGEVIVKLIQFSGD